MHAVTTTDPAGNATCVGCHTGTAFVARMNGATVTDTAYHPIDCYTCHEPHGLTAPTNDAHLIRNMASATLANGTKVTTAGEGILCIQCHQSRVNASTYVDSTAGSAHFGPHEGPQADMLMGTNGYTYGQHDPQLRASVCGAKHLRRLPHADGGGHRSGVSNAGDHTFRQPMLRPEKPPKIWWAPARPATGPDITTFNFPLFDYNGDGVDRGRPDRSTASARPAFHDAAA